MNTVKVRRDGSVPLPKAVARRLPAASTLVVWSEGDLVVLKRVSPPRVSEIAERCSGRAMSLKAVSAEIHRMRRERRGQRG